MSDTGQFVFAGDPLAWPARPGIVARIPPGIRSKHKLLAVLADRLHFPAWSGRNWDALEELLRDLSWLPGGDVTLLHCDLPFGPGGENRGTYLAILREACVYWTKDPARKLVVVFPESAAGEVTSLSSAPLDRS